MKRITPLFLVLGLLLTGCPPKENADGTTPTADATTPEADSAAPETDGTAPATDGTPTDGTAAEGTTADGAVANADGTAAPAEAAKTVTFSGDDALIQFVGTHADPEKPDPRTGTFGDFTGKADIAKGKLTSVHVDITTESLSTEIPKLTDHLKSGDFFNVNEFPKAEFKSTSIEDAGEGKVNITGDLTLLGKTKSITFPATVSTEDGLNLEAAFTVDRTEFGMDYGTENVLKAVEMTVRIPK